MKTIMGNLEDSLHGALSGNVRPGDRALYYLGASDAVGASIAALKEKDAASKESLAILGTVCLVMCDETLKATKAFRALPWWKRIVKRV